MVKLKFILSPEPLNVQETILEDAELAKQLAVDDKENAEHVMLVDLARNDLSRNGSQGKLWKLIVKFNFSHMLYI